MGMTMTTSLDAREESEEETQLPSLFSLRPVGGTIFLDLPRLSDKVALVTVIRVEARQHYNCCRFEQPLLNHNHPMLSVQRNSYTSTSTNIHMSNKHGIFTSRKIKTTDPFLPLLMAAPFPTYRSKLPPRPRRLCNKASITHSSARASSGSMTQLSHRQASRCLAVRV